MPVGEPSYNWFGPECLVALRSVYGPVYGHCRRLRPYQRSGQPDVHCKFKDAFRQKLRLTLLLATDTAIP